jgi:hypothetical protein
MLEKSKKKIEKRFMLTFHLHTEREREREREMLRRGKMKMGKNSNSERSFFFVFLLSRKSEGINRITEQQIENLGQS